MHRLLGCHRLFISESEQEVSGKWEPVIVVSFSAERFANMVMASGPGSALELGKQLRCVHLFLLRFGAVWSCVHLFLLRFGAVWSCVELCGAVFCWMMVSGRDSGQPFVDCFVD